MKNLIDTCTLINKLNSPMKLISLACNLKDKKEYLCITDIIFDELQITPNLEKEQKKISTGIINVIERQNNIINIISLKDNKTYKENLQNIRKRFYSDVTDVKKIRKLLQEGKIKKEQVKSLRNKDLGECSLIAVAITDPNNHLIVTEDGGNIIIKPGINLFEKYKEEYNINVCNCKEFLENIGEIDIENSI
ncbi:TPA: hypothetical protein PTV74_003948 [Clostridium botulinum]|uniref:hypothetical protein n=1 Tax=Clostridium botulinum TaxID=1491 RepID=UPI000D0DBF92|nr:hypothetical protein [Clostridium botulinum]PSM04080.1 hypothetical protein C6C12_00085 [Clostridium botulinum]HDK7140067.1 hypothetical protein [Clostridium botulinum]HDK7143655.1 hypothetical protein [Clostridium botulinum]HDK7147301.1 hypothetical protein [Clostridium botulinum]HDK7151043.1 hypothetical protein [Clostridium botulinum]